jgi:hypothetical protein
MARDKASLDIFWLKDDSLEDSANLPEPGVLAPRSWRTWKQDDSVWSSSGIRDRGGSEANLTLFYHGDLHAKIYFNEQNAIVTSQNLTWYERRSWEVGIALDRDVDDTAFIDMTKEASQLIRYSVPIYQNPVAANHVQLLSVWKERLAVIAQTDEDLPSITENDIALRQTFARQARKFSTAEEVLMQEMKQSGVPVNTMATIIQRTPSWVYWTRNRIAS